MKNKTKRQNQISEWTSASSQDKVIGTKFPLLPETTIKADKAHGTVVLGY